MMKRIDWKGLTAKEIATIPNDEFRLQTVERILKERNTYTDQEELILSTIKCVADDVSPHKEYENTYSDGWLDACNTVYDEVFAILRKAQEK
jgi:hypothetical protein